MREKDRNPGAGSLEAAASRRVTPQDIQQKEFAVSRLGGYRMRDVDEFLDQLTDAVTALTSENERLRTRAGGAPVVGTPDLDDVARQADEIIARARQEADRIVADAQGNRPTQGGGDRQAVGSFLEQERTFLNSLAALVQGHTEAVRGMVRDTRASGQSADAGSRVAAPRAEASGTKEQAGASAAPEARLEAPPKNDPSSTAAPRKPETARGDDQAKTQALPKPSPPVRVDEPEPAGVGRAEEGSPGDGDASLRELFWGEEG